MARTFLRQVTQIGESDTYDDTVVPSEANYETSPGNIEDDLNSLRSRANDILNRDGGSFAGNWWDSISAPSTFEGGTARGIQTLNQDLHDLQRKRILDRVSVVGADVTIASAGDQFVVLGAGELPGNTTMAVGAVSTLGTIAAAAASFGSAELTEVAGPNAIRPVNLCVLWYASGADIGSPVVDGSGEQIFGLLQSEDPSDGHTATATTPNRLQISFVQINSTGDDLVLIASGAIDGVIFDYAPVERFALSDLPEYAFLGTDFADSGVANATRQAAYDNQGATPVDLTTNATLDLEGAGLTWRIRDDLEANLFGVVEGSAGGTSQVNIYSDVDEFDIDAASVDFSSGIVVNSGGARPIDIGNFVDGVIGTTSGDFELQATAELIFDDGNQVGSTWAQDGIKLSETTAEWDDFESVFGEVSILRALAQAGTRTRVQATMTADVSADTDVNGPSFANNCDVDLPPFDQVTFTTAVDVFLNGNLARNNATSGAEDFYPGTSASNGDIRCTFDLVGTGPKPDQITIIVNGQ